MRRAAPILIAGGGIGGLALAVALGRRGLRSTVLERQEAPATVGAGIQLGPNGVRALQALGVADALERHVGTPDSIAVHDGASGRRLARLPLGQWISARHGAPYWVVHRADLHGALLAAAAADPRIEIRTGFELASVAQGPGEVTATGTDGRRIAGPVLAGADGLWSAVRLSLAADCLPQFAGATATRAVIPADAAGLLPASAVGVWLGPSAHVVHYPVRQGREIAAVVIAREAGRRNRTLGRTWDASADTERLQERLLPFYAGLADTLLPGPGHPWSWREWSLNTLAPLASWTKGRVVLLGDAAHPMLPYLAQGGALALEDAVVLADCLHTGAGDPVPALARFAALRTARARRVQAASVRQGSLYGLAPPLSWARDAALALLPGAWLMAGYDWLYAWLPPRAGSLAAAGRPGG
jgi:salicylate hydroxylase